MTACTEAGTAAPLPLVDEQPRRFLSEEGVPGAARGHSSHLVMRLVLAQHAGDKLLGLTG